MGECNSEKHSKSKAVYWCFHPSELASISKQHQINHQLLHPWLLQARNVKGVRRCPQLPPSNYSWGTPSGPQLQNEMVELVRF